MDQSIKKLVPVNRIEDDDDFTENKSNKILMVSSTKIIELASDCLEKAKTNVMSFSNINKITQNSAKQTITISLDNNKVFKYFCIYSMQLLKNIEYLYSKECLGDLAINIEY